jgi:hypothetical protein
MCKEADTLLERVAGLYRRIMMPHIFCYGNVLYKRNKDASSSIWGIVFKVFVLCQISFPGWEWEFGNFQTSLTYTVLKILVVLH